MTIYSIMVLLCVLSSSSIRAQENVDNYLKQVGLPKPQVVRDPFSPSPLMYEVLSSQAQLASPNMSGQTANLNPNQVGDLAVPKMKVRGFVKKQNDDAFALLEIAGLGTQMVKVGDQITFDPTKPNNKISIIHIDRLSVTASMSRLGTFRILK